MKEPCSNTHPEGENLLPLSVTGMDGVQRRRLYLRRHRAGEGTISPNPFHDTLILFFFFLLSNVSQAHSSAGVDMCGLDSVLHNYFLYGL